jgi:uncharacterized protein with HEPN domain
MRSSQRALLFFLNDIVIAIRAIEQYTNGIQFDAFTDDNKTKDAVIRNIEIVGEAARHVPSNIK